ncbi:PqqD family protein [Clostridium sp. BSD2780061688st1 H5]|uniref:PqqD family protein n=1 Tax=Eubacteriales TaxID=186802 RepID=UPI0011063086|nr:PqqD family protein [Clostridium sp. BSD2780061688st1 H5]
MYKTNDEYVLRKINGLYFLMSSGKCVNRKWVYQLNETGARIWGFYNTGGSFQELIMHLEKSYNRSFDDTEAKEIYAYVHQLVKEGLIRGGDIDGRGAAENNKLSC